MVTEETTIEADCVWALIIAKPGPLRNALRGLLRVVPHVMTVGADDAEKALRTLDRCHPALIVIDLGASGAGVWTLLKRVKGMRPPVRHILLADDVESEREARAAGASVVLVKGYSPAALSATIRALLPQSQEERVAYPRALSPAGSLDGPWPDSIGN